MRHDEHLLIADTAEEFAAAIGRLLNDAELRARLGTAGRAYVREHFDWASITARVIAGYDAALALRSSPVGTPAPIASEPPPTPPEVPPTPAAPTEAEGEHP